MLNFILSHALAAEVGCQTLDIAVPTPQRVASVHPEIAREYHEPEEVLLSYRIEFCDEGGDKIYLVQKDRKSGREIPPITAFNDGRIEKIYRPINLRPEALRGVPARVEVIERSSYAMTDSLNNLPMAELQFYSSEHLYSLSMRRSTQDEWRNEAIPEGNRAQQVKPEMRLFSPFRPLIVKAPVPENRGVRLVSNRFWNSPAGKSYVLWSLQTDGQFEMTYLIEVESGVAVPLVEAFVGTPHGMLLSAPEQKYDMFYFPELGRTVQLGILETEARQDPMSYGHWREVQASGQLRSPAAQLAARYHGTVLTEEQARFRRLFAQRYEFPMVLREWLDLLSHEDFADHVFDRPLALTRGREVSRDLLLREFPELRALALNDEGVAASVQKFAEASSELLLSGVLVGPRLRELIESHLEALPETPKDEASCQNFLMKAVAESRRDVTHQISRNLRKASLNLDILRIHLSKFREQAG